MLGKVDDAAHDMVRRRAVEAARGFVQEEELGVGQDLNTYAHSSLLPTADPCGREVASDPGVHGCLQTHVPDGRLCSLPLLRLGHRLRQLQFRRVVHRFSYRQRRHQDVILRHISLSYHVGGDR